jgi:hypothetical protein
LLNINSLGQTIQPKESVRQNDVRQYLHLDTILFFPNEEIVDGTDPVFTQWEDELVFTNFSRYKPSDTVVFYRISMQSKQIDTISFLIDNVRKSLKDNYSKQFTFIAYNKHYLVMGLFHKILIYKQDKNSHYIFWKEISTDFIFQEAWFLDKHALVFSDVYNSHIPSTLLCKYDIEKETVVQEINPFFNTLLLTYFYPRHLIDVKNDMILFAHQNEYAILIYDTSLNLVDSISTVVEGWKNLSTKTIDRINRKYNIYDAMDIMSAVSKYDFNIHQLRWIYDVDVDKFICVYRPPMKNNSFELPILHVWEKINNKWTITQNNIQDDIGFLYENDTLTQNTFPLGLLSNNDIFMFKNKIAILHKNATNINPVGMYKIDYFKQRNAYFVEKNPIVQIIIYNHTF